MSRPLVRTEVVDEDTANLMRQAFGTATQAYKNLSGSLASSSVSWYVFQRAFVAKPVEKRVCLAIRKALDEWIEWLWGEAKRRRKEEVA